MARRHRLHTLTPDQQAAVWPLVRAGANWRKVATEIDRPLSTVMLYAWSTGGVQPRTRCRSARQLTLADREEISRGLAEGLSLRSIATVLLVSHGGDFYSVARLITQLAVNSTS